MDDDRRDSARIRDRRARSRRNCASLVAARELPSFIELSIRLLAPSMTPGAQIMKLDSLKKLYIEELCDLYSAENQIVKALP
jgi:hypothetical protein